MSHPSSPLPHPRALAHLGDAVYELWVRETAIKLSDRNHDLHKYTTQRVNATTQAAILEILHPNLTDEEKALVKRAQNMPVTSSRRSNQSLHRQATAFEALIGYWHLVSPEKLAEQKSDILAIAEKFLQTKAPAG